MKYGEKIKGNEGGDYVQLQDENYYYALKWTKHFN